jgi:hypothetical protein
MSHEVNFTPVEERSGEANVLLCGNCVGHYESPRIF